MTRALPIAALLALAGCAGIDNPPPANHCASDADCESSTCNAELGMCIVPTRETVTIGLEVRPATEPYGGTVQPIPFAPFEVDGETTQDLPLQPGIRAHGIVRNGAGTPVAADLVFARQSPIPGAPANTVAIASSDMDPPNREGSNIAAFLTQILPGTHRLTVAPTGDWAAQLPPLDLVYETPENGDAMVEIQYPPICEDPTAESGCLRMFEGRVVDRAGTGQAGVVVKLVDRISGRTVSSRYVTASEAELDPGYFRVFFPVELWYAPDAWFLRVSPAPHRVEELGPSPVYTRPPDALDLVDGLIEVLSPDPSDLRITYSGTVETEDERPLEGASIRFTSESITHPETGFTGSYTTTVSTDENGRFEVELLGHPDDPASYDIVVTPRQADGQLGVLRVERRLGASAGGQLFTVPARARFGGTVQTVTGLRMLDARVEAQSRASDRDGTLSSAAFLARSNQTTTDPMGLFDLRLDVGLYDIVIEPPAGSGFPWRVERDVAIGGSEAPLTSVYELDHPVPITGVAEWTVDGGTQPVADGEVRAYAVIESDGATRAVLVGRATTDERGRYTLLLPPSI